jgi:hypothetical protein
MPIQINEVVVSVQVTGSQDTTQPPPTNTELNKQVKKSVDQILAVIKAQKER